MKKIILQLIAVSIFASPTFAQKEKSIIYIDNKTD